MSAHRRPFLLLLVLLGTLAAACGGSDGSSSEGAKAAGGAGTVITINNFEFAPETLQAKVGDTITVENKDSASHSVTASDKSFDTGNFGAGTKTFTVTKAGRFEFVCNVHPFMKTGVIQVA